ncbi:MAG: cell division protein FtsK [Candidatus Buchananbacteria bacterium CG10_big_fil_rev_8_21_14_0_10_42_9]|uniref:Cell division protein FtsK n=1 Tax=Candidatus Buchananbacteria bacterium CG10_big_fil_rev_8_21_14_0_10_42_9 TaxID=1974526 RepID=A0A2H0W3H6_9BACT|nr:MAG: cell division protein FtsK [Candidatus Buchananbacteria bacterium CG10_big_fil_rev_8_21_14_0_10_42_9]
MRFGKPKRRRKLGYDEIGGLSTEAKNGILAIVFFVLGIVALLSFLGVAGVAGEKLDFILSIGFGAVRWYIFIVFMALGYLMLRPDEHNLRIVHVVGLLLLVGSFSSFIHLVWHSDGLVTAAKFGYGGGYFGLVLSWPLLTFTGFLVSLVVLVALFLIGLILFFDTSLETLLRPIHSARLLIDKVSGKISDQQYEKAKRSKDMQAEEDYEDDEEEEFSAKEVGEEDEEEAEPEDDEEDEDEEEAALGDTIDQDSHTIQYTGAEVELPLDLLSKNGSKPTSGDIKGNQIIIKRTLQHFHINVDMGEVNVGPTVTQYTLKPAEGVKLSKIVSLNNDLALALAAHPIRIEAPIPGKSLVGIEVPNVSAATVSLRELLESPEYKARKSSLTIALGKNVKGQSFVADLTTMPHLLIAGATGSGKSVAINTLILSLLYQNSPVDLRFIMVDPKRVELPLYNGIPHLLTPVITDVKKTINALKWTIAEMERRFELLSKSGSRNILTYNKKAHDKLPVIVFIIDELADLMSTSGAEVEAGIIRLAQMARAVGIHLVLATQRPSVDVITGLMKANIPARVAFSVASLIDSRTILDLPGAEKLMGRGDMLFLTAELGKPIRLQGAFATEEEVKKVVRYLKDKSNAEYIDGITEKQTGVEIGSGVDDEGGEDELLGDAKQIIIQAGKASASLLQRRLRVGYARAARILDILEQQGFIGPADGAKPREILDPTVAEEEYDEQKHGDLEVEDEDESDYEEGEDEPEEEKTEDSEDEEVEGEDEGDYKEEEEK